MRSASGQFLATGAYSSQSQIRIRIWSWDPQETIDSEFFHRRLVDALAARRPFFDLDRTEALRLVHGESDGLPGLILDRYGGTLVMQCLSSGIEYWRESLADILLELTGAERIYERSDVEVRKLEGLPERKGAIRGGLPPERILIHENDLKFEVDVYGGHKTGFYLDQRLNRAAVGSLSKGRKILDCFAYTGGFTLSALAGGADSVLAVDASIEVLEQARRNLALNSLPEDKVDWQVGDVFQVLRGLRDRGQSFDLIVLDPPKFAATASQAGRAARGYKDINLLAFKLLRPGGLLATFSCSGGVSAELFQKIVAGAALDAGVDARILERLHQSPDHPVALNFPEGAYLKGFIIQVAE